MNDVQVQAAKIHVNLKEQKVKKWEDIYTEGDAIITNEADAIQETIRAIFPMGLSEAAKRFLQECDA